MSVSEFMRKKRALVYRWALRSQDENARRLDEGRMLNKATGKDAARMQVQAVLTLALKAHAGKGSTLGVFSGEMKRSLQDRKNIALSTSGSKVDCEIQLPEEVARKLGLFETERIWSPTKKEAAYLTLRAFEAGMLKGYGPGSSMRRPARPFFGRTAKADKLLAKEYQELVKKYMTESLRKRLAESNKRARLKIKLK